MNGDPLPPAGGTILSEEGPIVMGKEEDLIRASRYLLMPILAVASDLKYVDFHQKYPYIDLLNPNYLEQDYGTILNSSLEENFPVLTRYLLERVNPEDHPGENLMALFISANRNNLPMFQSLLKIISDPTDTIDINEVKSHFTPVEFDIVRNVEEDMSNITVIEASSLGQSNDILHYLSQDPRFQKLQEHWDYGLRIAIWMDNYDAIDIIRPLLSQDMINDFIDNYGYTSGTSDSYGILGHLILPRGTDPTEENLLIYGLRHQDSRLVGYSIWNMDNDTALRVLRDNINWVNGIMVATILDTRKGNDREFRDQFYDLIRKNKSFLLGIFDEYIQ